MATVNDEIIAALDEAVQRAEAKARELPGRWWPVFRSADTEVFLALKARAASTFADPDLWDVRAEFSPSAGDYRFEVRCWPPGYSRPSSRTHPAWEPARF